MPNLLPIALAVVSPMGAPGAATEESVARLTQAVEAASATIVTRLPDARVAACQGSFSCFVQLARPDYDAARVGGRSFREYLAARDEAVAQTSPPLLIVLSVLTTSAAPSAALAVLDTDEALAAWHDSARGPDARATADAAIAARALALDRAPTVIDADALAARALAALEPALKPRRAWGPTTELELRAGEDGTLFVDGARVGPVRPGLNRYRGVVAGPARAEVTLASGWRWSCALELAPGVVTRHSVERPDSTARDVTVYGGAALAVGGAAVGITALALASASTPAQVCLAPADALSGCPGDARVGFGFDPERPASSPGPPLASIALGLLGAGATSAVVALLTDEGEVPWIAWVAGLALGTVGAVAGALE